MFLPRNVSLAQVALGAVASLVILKVARPVLVGVLRAGFEVKDLAQDTWNSAKNEVREIKDEARGKSQPAKK